MFSQKLWLVVIVNTLLLRCCFADNALSIVKTSSGSSLHSTVESEDSEIEVNSDGSFSKSESSFAASQSETAQIESSIINTENGTSLQDSSFYSSNNNISSSNSDIVASDGFISQTESNFESSSSTTAESDTSITTTPNSTVMSSTTSSSKSTISSNSVTSSSVSGRFLDNGEADISFPDDFPLFGSSYKTKSLDSIPDYNDDQPTSPDLVILTNEDVISTSPLPSINSHESSTSPTPGLQDSPMGLYPSSPYDSVANPLENHIPIEMHPAPDHLGDLDSPFEHLQSQQPYDILKNSPANGEDLLTPIYVTPDLPSTTTDQNSTPTLVSMDTNLDGFVSPEEIIESTNPSLAPLSPMKTIEQYTIPDLSYLPPESSNPSLVSPSPIEIIEQSTIPDLPYLPPKSSNPTLAPLSPIETIEQSTIPDLSYLPPSGYDDALILTDNKEYLGPDKFLPNGELLVPLHEESLLLQQNPGYFNPYKLPYDELLIEKGTSKPKPLPQYPGFYKPLPGYPGYGYPRFPSDKFPFPYRGPHFRKYPPYFPNFRNPLSNYPPIPLSPFYPLYPFPYGNPMMSPYGYPGNNPLFYDYPRNYLQPLPQLGRPEMPDFLNTPPPFFPGNPILSRPLYPGGLPFDSPQKPHYVLPAPEGTQLSPDSLLPLPPADLNLLLENQPLPDLPLDSLQPQSPFDSLTPDSSLVQPHFPSEFNSDSPFVPDLSPTIDSPLVIPDSSHLALNDSPAPIATLESLPHQPMDLDTNLPLTTSDMEMVRILHTPVSIDDEIFDVLKQQYEGTIAEYQLSNSIYPRDISPNFGTMTDEELTFNFVILGSSPAALSALKTLSDTGKSILIVERGDLPPHVSKSLYYRPKMLQSDYVRRIKSSAPHCSVEKILYAPNVFGDESTYDSNVWDYGVRSKYMKWGKLSPKWTWNNILQYFTDDSDQLYTSAIPVSTEIENTEAIKTITNIFNNVGLYLTDYEKGKRSEGLTVLPYLHENGENIIFAEKIFQQLTNYNNIQLALRTTPESIVFDNNGKATGVVVKTPCGKIKTISVLDELIIASNPVDTVQFLYQSGIGDHERLQQLNIPTQINLPYVGKELMITPLNFGLIYLFPRGTLLTDYESDFIGKDYLFGKYGLPSALAIDYFKATLKIYEAREANVVFNFRVFSKSMPERLNSFIARLAHIDLQIEDFLTNLCQEYDLLLAVPQLTNVLSRGEIVINDSNGEFQALVDTGMYKSKRDLTIMQKALKVLQSIAETEIFKSMNGQVVQIPVELCGQPDFSVEYTQCSIRYLSLPNLHYSGGAIMGISPLTSVVNEDLLVHGTENVRILGASVVPYGTSTDSSAVSSMVGNLGAYIISQKYSL